MDPIDISPRLVALFCLNTECEAGISPRLIELVCLYAACEISISLPGLVGPSSLRLLYCSLI